MNRIQPTDYSKQTAEVLLQNGWELDAKMSKIKKDALVFKIDPKHPTKSSQDKNLCFFVLDEQLSGNMNLEARNLFAERIFSPLLNLMEQLSPKTKVLLEAAYDDFRMNDTKSAIANMDKAFEKDAEFVQKKEKGKNLLGEMIEGLDEAKHQTAKQKREAQKHTRFKSTKRKFTTQQMEGPKL